MKEYIVTERMEKPPAVMEAVREYQREVDPVWLFLSEEADLNPAEGEPRDKVYEVYEA